MGTTDFIPLNPQLEKTFSEICLRIRRLQSGGTIDSLQAIGADTDRQVGASYVSLKTLASEYPPDERLASLLWNQRKREEQIMACFLLPTTINKEKITQFINNSISFETAGYFGSIFLSRHPLLLDILPSWLDSEEPFLQTAILSASARHTILYGDKGLIDAHSFRQIVSRSYSNKYVELVAQRYRFNI